jgi:hypothetical protein
VPKLIKAKKPTMAKIHILFLRDTLSAKDLLSAQQSAGLVPASVPVTIDSTCHLLFMFLFFFADKTYVAVLLECTTHPSKVRATLWYMDAFFSSPIAEIQ